MLQDRGLRAEILHSPDGEPPSAFMSLLSAAEYRSIVRITGGCAEMTSDDALPLDELFREAFKSFKGAILIGGTRMTSKEDPPQLIPGITEVGPLIRTGNPTSVLLGIVPRAESVSWNFTTGSLVIERSELDEPRDTNGVEFQTIVQPNMDAVVVLGKRLTKKSIWHDEAVFCARVTEVQRNYAKWTSALVVYNGGGTTEFEARLVADQHWPVILIRGSGRTADKLANDSEFMRKSAGTTIVCDLDPTSLRNALIECGSIERPPMRGLLMSVS